MDCSRCFDCCRHKHTEHKDKYDGVKYQKVCGAFKEGNGTSEDIDIILPQYEKVPLQKIFEFQQLQHPAIHPQLFGVPETKRGTITQQPSFIRLDNTFHNEDNEPRIQFSLYYDIQRCTLTITLISATDLIARGHKRTNIINPFVLVFLIPNREQIFESTVLKNTDNPIFHDVSFEFNGLPSDEVRRQTLILRVLNKLKSAIDIGIVALPLENVDLFGVEMNVKLTEETSILNQSDCNGDILISLMLDGSADMITGMVLKAINLLRMDIGGLSDPYVSIHLCYNDKRKCKWKSSIKHRTLFPVYNESFQFDIKGMDIKFLHLELTVKDHDRVGQNDMIGVVKLGEQSDHTTGHSHWMEMISSPCNQISFWHSLKRPPTVSTLKRLSLKPTS